VNRFGEIHEGIPLPPFSISGIKDLGCEPKAKSLSNKKLRVKYCEIRSYGLSVVKERGGELRIILLRRGSQELSKTKGLPSGSINA